MDEDRYNGAFELILNAGNSKSQSLMAIEAARESDFDEAKRCLEEAEKELRLAHKAQVDMIQQEAQGKSIDVNIILIHAQDHLTMAMMAKEFAEEFVNLYKTINEFKGINK